MDQRKPFITSLRPRGLLSFSPEAQAIELRRLNVIIGPNGSGKSNLVELLELLKATPTDLLSAIRDGGGVNEWLWKGKAAQPGFTASLEAHCNIPASTAEVRYRIAFASVVDKLEIVDEVVEEVSPRKKSARDVYFFYRFQGGHPAINYRQKDGSGAQRSLSRENVSTQQSVLSQRRDPDLYPELTSLSKQFTSIATYREWSFGRYTPLRQPQPPDLPDDRLLPDAKNLGLVLNNIEHSDRWPDFLKILKRFLPRLQTLSTRIQSNTVQVFLHETGLRSPIPATRLSDGTIRFIVLLAILIRPELTPLICIEEPELGLHPDAISLIADLVVDASTKTQVLVTTQSDGLVSLLTDELESVLVCENVAGGTELRRLAREPLSAWLEKYKLGDLWKIGEIGGNP